MQQLQGEQNKQPRPAEQPAATYAETAERLTGFDTGGMPAAAGGGESAKRQGMRARVCCVALTIYSFLLANGLADLQERVLSRGARLPDGTNADAAIVLGYALKRDGIPTAPLRLRVDAAVGLFEEGRVQNLLFSGGHPGGGLRTISEAEAMRRYAQRATRDGIPPDRIVLEELSTSTRTNAVNSLQLVAARRWKSVVVATNPFHQFRAYRTFECASKQTLPPDERPQIWLAEVAGPSPLVPAHERALYALRLQYDIYREFAAILWYWLLGYLC